MRVVDDTFQASIVNSFLERFLVVFGFRHAVSCDFTYMSIFLHEPVGNGIYIVHKNALTFFFLLQLVYW